MGTKYSSNTVSGYNASPPPDDGSSSASNQITWAKIKTKIGDALNTAIAAINSGLVTAFDYSSRSITTSDSAIASDHMRTIEIASTVSSVVTLTLSDAATMAAGYTVNLVNRSNFTAIVTRATASDVIDNAASATVLLSLMSCTYKVNASANGYLSTAKGAPNRGIVDAATATALELSGSGANHLTSTAGATASIGTNSGNLNCTSAFVGTGLIQAVSGTATPAGGASGSGVYMGSASLAILFGSGAPTVTATQGSLYIRTDGGVNTRLYSNNNGSNGWTGLTSS